MYRETFTRDSRHNETGLPRMPGRFNPERFLQAMAAGCAAVACADGDASESERSTALGLMRNDPLLSVYPAAMIAAVFDQHIRAFAADEPAAFFDAIGLIGQIANRPDQARRVLRACLVLTGADGRTHLGEIAAIHAVRSALGLDPPPGGPDTADLSAAISVAAATAGPDTLPVRFKASLESLRSVSATVARSAQVRALSRRPAQNTPKSFDTFS